jgi:hypothetical protein
MFESLNSRNSFFSIRDFEFSLSLVYNILSKNNQFFLGLNQFAPNILEGFRNATGSLSQSKVIEFNFRR